MIFIGYPLSYDTTCKLFGANPEGGEKNLQEVVTKKGLTYQWVDKNVSLLGLEVKEVSNIWSRYTSVDESIMLIMKYKIMFVELIQKSGIDISEVEIECMESEPIFVKNPPPYVFAF